MASEYATKLFITKFPLKWGIVGLCSSSNTGDTDQNAFSVKSMFSHICKIRKFAKEFDMDPILKMFGHLKAKIRKDDQDGLRSLTKK